MTITVIQSHDSDGDISMEVRHTSSGEIVLAVYGTHICGMDYSGARDLQRSLGAMLDSLDAEEPEPHMAGTPE